MTITPRPAPPREARRASFAVAGGLCCALLAYLDYRTATGGLIDQAAQSVAMAMAPAASQPVTQPPVAPSAGNPSRLVAVPRRAFGRVVAPIVHAETPLLRGAFVDDRSNVELARARGSGNDRWRGVPAQPDFSLTHDRLQSSDSDALVDAARGTEPLTAASLPASLVATSGSAPAAMVAPSARHDLEPTATLAPAAVANMPLASPSVPVKATVPDEELIRGTLTQFRTAYSHLDVNAARRVWPSVDARALGRAFDGLKEQALLFDRCDLAVNGVEASAACSGRATYVPRVGSAAARTDRREWNFRLKKVDQSWTIASANAR